MQYCRGIVRYPSCSGREYTVLYLLVVGELYCGGSEVDSPREHMCLWPDSRDEEICSYVLGMSSSAGSHSHC